MPFSAKVAAIDGEFQVSVAQLLLFFDSFGFVFRGIANFAAATLRGSK